MKSINRIILSVLFVAISLGITSAQGTMKNNPQTLTAITKMIADSNMVFNAEYVIVSGGNVANSGAFFNGTNSGPTEIVRLDKDCYLTIKPATLTSTLPFFDRDHYKKPATDKNTIQTASGKMSFTEDIKKYNYTVKQLKGGEYEITISPLNKSRGRYFLEIDTDGKAKLTLLYIDGSTISYRGSVTQQI